MSAADGLIVVGGSWGTLNEVALAVRMGKPVVSLAGWTVTADGSEVAGVTLTDSPEDAVSRLLLQLGRPVREDN